MWYNYFGEWYIVATINKIDTKKLPKYNSNSGKIETAAGNIVSEIIDVVEHEVASTIPLVNIAGNDGYEISHYTNINGENLAFANKEGENSILYLTDKDNNNF